MKKIKYICDFCNEVIKELEILAVVEEYEFFNIKFVCGGVKKHICEERANKINYTIDEVMRITEELQEM